MSNEPNNTPLAWSERIQHMGRLERFLTVGAIWFCPYVRERKQMEKRVQRRGDVSAYWPSDPRLIDTLDVVKRALIKEMDWPVADFIPADRCEVLFKSKWSDALDASDAASVIARNLGLPNDFDYHFVECTLGELVENLTCARTR